jgi:FAD/FMN-containing dehydrogenase
MGLGDPAALNVAGEVPQADRRILAVNATGAVRSFRSVCERLIVASRRAARVTAAMAPIRAIAPGAGSYVNETDYFEENWQEAFWGSNYAHLQAVKNRYDPTNLFRVHHGAGAM